MTDFAKYVPDVKKYAGENANELAVKKIVTHLGIALRVGRDAATVAASDPAELETVRESWLKRKLALTQSDAELDQAIAEVMTKMKGNTAKSRVTVYYLLAEKFGKIAELAA